MNNEYKLLIGGELTSGEGCVDIVNPATQEIIAKSPTASVEQLNNAVSAAAFAFREWSETSFEERKSKLLAFAEVIEKNSNELARLVTMEQGKVLTEAHTDVELSLKFCRYFAEQSLPVEVLVDSEEQRVEVHHKPFGVVAAINPWNFPLLQAVYKIAPALITGNTLVLKPSPSTPLTTLMLGEFAATIFPPGVLNIIADNNDLGSAITSHPGIAKVCFTGSTATGKKIMASAANTLKRLTLELGGNDAAIVLDDVDPKAVAPGIFGAAFLCSGQVCLAIKRLYVHDSIYDELCKEIATLASSAVVGNGLEDGVQFGPIQNKMQLEKVRSYIHNARQHGNIIASSAIPEGPGNYVPLTVVRDVEDGIPIVDEEQFGPVLPIIKYSDLDDVIERANNSPYGLGGSVWSSNIERAHSVARRINTGTVWINQHCVLAPNVPFPPAKESGIGVEWGKEGLLEFTNLQVININKS